MNDTTITELQTDLQFRMLQKILELPTKHPLMQKTKLHNALSELPEFEITCEHFKRKCPKLTEFDFEMFSDIAYSYGMELLKALINAKIIKVSFLDEKF